MLEEREKWRQTARAWAARLMEGLQDKSLEYQEALQRESSTSPPEHDMLHLVNQRRAEFADLETRKAQDVQNAFLAGQQKNTGHTLPSGDFRPLSCADGPARFGGWGAFKTPPLNSVISGYVDAGGSQRESLTARYACLSLSPDSLDKKGGGCEGA